MRQGDGSDLPGVNAPRNADIGIIYVAPNDVRQSVLAAILTQERLGRKQVAIVLPEQNRAFQRPVDFDGLKNMRRGLRTQIVFVAPSGSGPAELAHQRRFPVYSSLEDYAKSVREGTQAGGIARKGWLSLGGRKPADDPSASPTNPVGTGQVQPLSNMAGASAQAQQSGTADDMQDAPQASSILLGAAAAAGATTVIDSGLLAAGESSPSAPPPAASGAQSAAGSLPEDAPTREITGVQPPIASPGTAGEDDPGSKIIQLSATRGGTTDKIPIPAIMPVPAAQPQVPQMSPASSTATTRRMDSGNIAAVGVGAAAIAAGGASAARTARGGGTPPTRRSAAGQPGAGPAGPRRPVRRSLLSALLVLLVALLAIGGTIIAYASPGILGRFNLPNILPKPPSATVKITPASTDLKNTYTLFGVTGVPDSSLRQVQARQLTSTTPAQSKTANATGVGHTPGIQATGTITFYNGSTSVETVGAGTRLTGNDGVTVITDAPAVIPGAQPPTEGSVTISAHAADVGEAGNIGTFDIDGTCCFAGNFVTVRNTAPFTGGQDPQTFAVVQQSDIDSVANSLKMRLMPAAQQSLQMQVQPNERFISPRQCTPNVTSDHAAGDRANNVTVTVKVTCTGEVYDLQGAQTIAANLLKQQATSSPGPGYALTGNLVTGITQITVTDAKKGTLELFVTAEGVWVFQFSNAQKQALAKLIAGKSKQTAQALLLQQMGVKQVDIQLSGGDGKTLPTDPTQINIVLNVPGLQVTTPTTPTTGPGAGSPTVPTAVPTSPAITPTVGLGSR